MIISTNFFSSSALDADGKYFSSRLSTHGVLIKFSPFLASLCFWSLTGVNLINAIGKRALIDDHNNHRTSTYSH